MCFKIRRCKTGTMGMWREEENIVCVVRERVKCEWVCSNNSSDNSLFSFSFSFRNMVLMRCTLRFPFRQDSIAFVLPVLSPKFFSFFLVIYKIVCLYVWRLNCSHTHTHMHAIFFLSLSLEIFLFCFCTSHFFRSPCYNTSLFFLPYYR